MAKGAERAYASRLGTVAKQVKALIKAIDPDEGADEQEATTLIATLKGYAKIIRPWAMSVSNYMLADMARRNAKAWRSHGEALGRSLRQTIEQTPVGTAYRDLFESQVGLIQSIPSDAAERVQAAVVENMYASTRSTELAKAILKTQDIPAWRAKLIARTETSRASTALTQARAIAIGSEGYIWRTSNDADVRDTHQSMEGKYVRWDTPPKTDKNLAPYHAGCGPNCRCYPEPVLPDY